MKTDGTVWAWGYNAFGQLGNGTVISSNVPIQMGNDTDWVEISGCGHSSFAIKQNGTLWSWGLNNFGQLGVGNTANIPVPTQLGTATNWSKIESGGYGTTIAKKTDGTFWSWGLNYSGELGIGTTINRTTPTFIPNFSNCNYFKIKDGHVVAIKLDTTLWLWGNNLYGQIGDNSSVNRLVPTIILCPSLSLEEMDFKSNIIVFPNPTNGKINVQNLANSIIDKVEFFTEEGKLVFTKNTNDSNVIIDVTDLSNAIYLIKIHSNNSIDKKILLKK